ncbi:MAG: arsenate reductase family protein [Clostridia bacterium]|nr:arsenate reductase family protein [Clostridia bacterium]
MKNVFLEYPKCSTCQKAKKWLQEENIEIEERHIVENNPTKQELKKWIATSQMDIKKWFNTSGLKYKELGLKDKLESMNEEEKIAILASDGMLVKRPILITAKGVCPGFREEVWEKLLK